MMIEIEFLKAKKGDCFIIKYNGTNILIDGGTPGVYTVPLKGKLKKLEQIDLVVVTHIDRDHIGGIKKLFEDDDINYKVKKILFNSGASIGKGETVQREIPIDKTTEDKSFGDGITLERKLLRLGIWNKENITNETPELNINDIKIRVLAPFKKNIEVLNEEWDSEIKKMKEEEEKESLMSGSLIKTYKNINEVLKVPEKIKTTIINESSIVLLIEINDKKFLFTGDTSDKNLLIALKNLGYSKDNPIKLDLFKLPHHGSEKNLSKELVKMIDCNKYLISTNGSAHGRSPGHPDKEALAKIISFNKDKEIELIFNYESVFEDMFSKEDEEKYTKFKCKKENNIQI